MKKLLFALLLVIVISSGALYWLLSASLPGAQSQASLPGLSAIAQLRYDDWQRAYVEAESLQDAMSVQGWLHASHRLWQMELFRRAGKGRMAELFGADLLETDIALWRVGVPQLGAKLEHNAAPETLALIDSYIAGINAAIANYTMLPPEFLLLRADVKPWQRSDVFAVGALVAYQSANNMDNELVRLALSSHLDKAHFDVFAHEHLHALYEYVLPKAVDGAALAGVIDALAATSPSHNPLMPRLGFGSNGWVVSAQASSEGAPLFAFDSHDELGLPNLFYEVHLFFGAGKQLRGWSTPGLPGVINGFNSRIAWGFTNIGDTQDMFIETRLRDGIHACIVTATTGTRHIQKRCLFQLPVHRLIH